MDLGARLDIVACVSRWACACVIAICVRDRYCQSSSGSN